jgi:hypothetical protein
MIASYGNAMTVIAKPSRTPDPGFAQKKIDQTFPDPPCLKTQFLGSGGSIMKTIAMSRVRSASALVILLTITGCASGRAIPNQPALPIGSELQINLSADVPVDQHQVYIQNQMVVSKAQIDKEQVFCSVVMKGYQEPGERQMKVEPGKFTVWRVRLYNDFLYNPTIYANTDDQQYTPSYGIDFRTELHLKSSEESDVIAVTCTEHRPKYLHQNTFPDRSHFAATLGDFVTLP